MRAFSFPSFGKKTPNPFKRQPNNRPSGHVDGVEIRLDLCFPAQLPICILFFLLSVLLAHKERVRLSDSARVHDYANCSPLASCLGIYGLFKNSQFVKL